MRGEGVGLTVLVQEGHSLVELSRVGYNVLCRFPAHKNTQLQKQTNRMHKPNPAKQGYHQKGHLKGSGMVPISAS